MKSNITIHQVAGKLYKVWGDIIARAMFAEDEEGTVKRIHGSGYLNNDLTIRKAISYAFNLSTFRK